MLHLVFFPRLNETLHNHPFLHKVGESKLMAAYKASFPGESKLMAAFKASFPFVVENYFGGGRGLQGKGCGGVGGAQRFWGSPHLTRPFGRAEGV